MSVFSSVFFLIAFWGVSQRGAFENTGCFFVLSKEFYKNLRKTTVPIISRFVIAFFLGVSRQREFKNTIKKIKKYIFDPTYPFLASNLPTFFFAVAPWVYIHVHIALSLSARKF
jgi:hypothetical protein